MAASLKKLMEEARRKRAALDEKVLKVLIQLILSFCGMLWSALSLECRDENSSSVQNWRGLKLDRQKRKQETSLWLVEAPHLLARGNQMVQFFSAQLPWHQWRIHRYFPFHSLR